MERRLKWYSITLFFGGVTLENTIDAYFDGDYIFMTAGIILFLFWSFVVPRVYRDLQQGLVTKQTNTADEK